MDHSMYYFEPQAIAPRPKQGFAMPADISVRREHPGAARAYEAAHLSRYPKDVQARLLGCNLCGELAPPHWCLTCERDKKPYRASRPHLRAPYCNPCLELDLKCRVCGVAPSAGPTDMDFAPAGWHPGAQGVVMQVAGFM